MSAEAPNGQRPVVVGLDESPEAEAALTFALREATRRGVELRVVTAVPIVEYWIPKHWPAAWGATRADAIEQVVRLAQADTESTVARVRSALVGDPSAAPAAVTLSVVAGNPTAVLLEAAGQADLLVLGSRGRGGVASATLGSVSLHCLQHAPCPVTVVRPQPT
jgi:nucleotide-binding universal stress UspA family protein